MAALNLPNSIDPDASTQPSLDSESTRREFIFRCGALSLLALGLVGCEKRFKRPAGVHNMGQVQHRLFPRQHIRDRSLLLFRDDAGWFVLSTRCTYDGCDLTFQNDVLLCSCCESMFSHEGKVLKGPALDNLPYYEIFYGENHLFANAGKEVKPDYRYTTPEIERAISKLRERIKNEKMLPTDNIPPILWNGQGAASDVPVDRGTSNLGLGDLYEPDGKTP